MFLPPCDFLLPENASFSLLFDLSTRDDETGIREYIFFSTRVLSCTLNNGLRGAVIALIMIVVDRVKDTHAKL